MNWWGWMLGGGICLDGWAEWGHQRVHVGCQGTGWVFAERLEAFGELMWRPSSTFEYSRPESPRQHRSHPYFQSLLCLDFANAMDLYCCAHIDCAVPSIPFPFQLLPILILKK